MEVREATENLKVEQATVATWCREGRGPAPKEICKAVHGDTCMIKYLLSRKNRKNTIGENKMKRIISILLIFCTLALFLASCGIESNVTEKDNSVTEEKSDPVAKAALEKLVSIIKANNYSDAADNINGTANTYRMKELYVSAKATSSITFHHEEKERLEKYKESSQGNGYYSSDLCLSTYIDFDETGIMSIKYSLYGEYSYYNGVYIETKKDVILNGKDEIAAKDFSKGVVDIYLPSPNITYMIKWVSSSISKSDLGSIVKEEIRAQIFRMLDCIISVSDISLEDLGFYEGIENDVPPIYADRYNQSTTPNNTSISTDESTNKSEETEKVINFIKKLVPINNKISELHMTITFGVTMNGVVNYDQLTDLISEYSSLTDVLVDVSEESNTEGMIDILSHYIKILDRLEQFCSEYDSTTSKSKRAIYWKEFHSYYCHWKEEWFEITDKYTSQ